MLASRQGVFQQPARAFSDPFELCGNDDFFATGATCGSPRRQIQEDLAPKAGRGSREIDVTHLRETDWACGAFGCAGRQWMTLGLCVGTPLRTR